ncbi:MAG: GC-type dockerin domain-anchored protein [Planctomycetota bacterium]|nr:GC-type dockerin domain-anchored protein [Planctomycetota bacterium]
MTRVATLTVCAADFNCDGAIDMNDFDDFVTDFESGAFEADVDGDGFLTFEDFDAFVRAFDSGC